MATQRRRMLDLLVYVVLVFLLSMVPRSPDDAIEALIPGPKFFFRDKLAHIISFVILGMLLFRALRWNVSPWRWATFGFLFATAATIGALNELFQAFVPGREVGLGDWAADLFGAAIGIGIFTFTAWGVRGGTSADRIAKGS